MKAKFAAPDVRDAVDPSDLDREVTHYAIPHLEEFGVPIVQHSSEIESGKLLVKQGDVLISKLNPRKSRVFKVGEHDVRPVIASGEFIVFRPRCCHPDFLAYLLQSDTVTGLLSASAKSVTRSHQRVDPATVRNIELPDVSVEQQRRIAEFLDRETAQIDELIAKQEQLISTLAERRTSVVLNGVSRGFSGVELKDSEADWLGKVPAHWMVRRLKYSVRFSKNGVWGDEPDGGDSDVWVRSSPRWWCIGSVILRCGVMR